MGDTAGQERFRALASTTFRGCHAVIVMYDIPSHESFSHAVAWVEEARRHCPAADVFVVANKIDLEHLRAVPSRDGEDLALSLGAVAFVEVSAFQRSSGIDEVLTEIATDVVN